MQQAFQLLEVAHGNVEMDVHHTLALELYPDSIRLWPGKHDLELDHLMLIHTKRMEMQHVDEVVARGEHMCPGAEISRDRRWDR